jgi:hypothetical protein
MVRREIKRLRLTMGPQWKSTGRGCGDRRHFFAAVGFAAAFFRKAILDRLISLKHDFDDQLALQQNVFDRHLAAIRHEHNLDLERLRSDLRIDAFRNETRFSALHTERAKAIADVYAALRNARAAIANYVTDMSIDILPSWSERRMKAQESLRVLEAAFNPKEIYFPAHTASSIRAYIFNSVTHVNKFERDVETNKHRPQHYFETWDKILIEVTGASKDLFEQLREEFRLLLGDDAPPPASACEAK